METYYAVEVWDGDALLIPCSDYVSASRVVSLTAQALDGFAGFGSDGSRWVEEGDYQNVVLELEGLRFVTDGCSGIVALGIFDGDLWDFVERFSPCGCGCDVTVGTEVLTVTVAGFKSISETIGCLSDLICEGDASGPASTIGDFVACVASGKEPAFA